MARATRKLNDRQKRNMIRRKMAVAAQVARLPSVAIMFTGSGKRSGKQNAIIARKQIKQKRNAFSMLRADLKQIHASIDPSLDRLREGEKQLLGSILNKTGQMIVDLIRRHIDNQRRLAPVSEEYAKRITGGKILKRTGQLYDSLAYKIRLGG